MSDEILAEIVPDVVLADALPEETTPPVDVETAITDVAPVSNAAALALRERLALHGFALEDNVPLADVSHQVLEALLEALPAEAGPRPSEEELRGQLAERIAQAHRLPRGVRERLTGMLTTIRFDDSGRDEPTLRVSDAIALLEETLPAHLLLSADDAQATAHPRGDSFFTGDPRHLSDEDARRIAAEQLARTGYRRA